MSARRASKIVTKPPVDRSSRIALSRTAYRHNLAFLRTVIGPDVRLCSVIKGNAYGHGIEHVVPLAEDAGVDCVATFSAGEAARAFAARTRPGTHVMIMGYIADHDLGWAIENDVSFFVSDLARLRAARETAHGLGKPARVHLEIETGLHRTGLEPDALIEALELIRGHPDAFAVDGVCTHYAGAESDANHRRIHDQIRSFDELTRVVHDHGIRPRLRHTACSAAALVYPETHLDMVRIGIAQFGFWPSQETRLRFLLSSGNPDPDGPDPLRRVMRWSSQIMDVRTYGPGLYVGYGQGYLTTRTERFASIPVGYAHGFSRGLSNLGHVLVHGRPAPVAGLVNMNMMLVNITEIPKAARGDEVVIIGKQQRRAITVGSFGDLTGHLNYEILAHLSESIPRTVT